MHGKKEIKITNSVADNKVRRERLIQITEEVASFTTNLKYASEPDLDLILSFHSKTDPPVPALVLRIPENGAANG